MPKTAPMPMPLSPSGWTPLHEAVAKGENERLPALLAAGWPSAVRPKWGIQENEGRTPLEVAAQAGNVTALRCFRELNPSLSCDVSLLRHALYAKSESSAEEVLTWTPDWLVEGDDLMQTAIHRHGEKLFRRFREFDLPSPSALSKLLFTGISDEHWLVVNELSSLATPAELNVALWQSLQFENLIAGHILLTRGAQANMMTRFGCPSVDFPDKLAAVERLGLTVRGVPPLKDASRGTV